MLSVARGPRSAPRLCSGRPRECVDRQSSKRGEQLKNRAAIGNWRLHREDQGYHPALRRAIRTRTPDDRTAAYRHRVNVDFPVDLLRAIDREARRIGVTRQAFIKLRLADTLAGSR